MNDETKTQLFALTPCFFLLQIHGIDAKATFGI
jgi:hypothetical protein